MSKKKEGWKKAVLIAMGVLLCLVVFLPVVVGMLMLVTACSNYDWFSEEWVDALKWPALLIGLGFLLVFLLDIGYVVIRALVKILQAQLMSLPENEESNPALSYTNPPVSGDFNSNDGDEGDGVKGGENREDNDNDNQNDNDDDNDGAPVTPGEKTKSEVLEIALKYETDDGLRRHLKREVRKLSQNDMEQIMWLIQQPDGRIRYLAKKILESEK